MNRIEIKSLPSILFSHIYEPENYHTSFPVRENLLEVTYIAEGSFDLVVGNDKYRAKKGDIICSLYNAPALISTDNFHSHHTVAARVDWVFSNEEQSLFLPILTPEENNTSSICILIDDFVHNHMIYKSSKALGAAKFLELLCEIDKCNRKAQKTNLPSELLYTERAKKYINQNINACITQKSVAEYLGISPEYLCSLFKKTEGITILCKAPQFRIAVRNRCSPARQRTESVPLERIFILKLLYHTSECISIRF